MKMYPLEPAGEDLLRRTQAHSVADREFPVSAAHLFALLEEGPTCGTSNGRVPNPSARAPHEP
jgi:hypothetical protein